MVLDLNKYLAIGLFFFCYNAAAQNSEVDLLLKDTQPVVKKKFSNVYKMVSSQDLGEVTKLNFELISAKNIKDSIFIEFLVWYCPYFAQVNKEKRKNDCPCNDRLFSYYSVSVKQKFHNEVGAEYKAGIYKALKLLDKDLCINEKHSITMEKDTVYNLVFKLDNSKAVYVRLEEQGYF